MPNLTLPNTLTPAYWNKQVGSLEKPAKMVGLLNDLKSKVDKLPTQLLELGGIEDVDAAAKRDKELRGDFDKAAKAVADQCKSITTLANDLAAKFKKDAGSAKQAAPAAAAVAKESPGFGKSVQDACAKALNDLKSLTSKLEADAKKSAADQKKAAEKEEDSDDGAADEKDDKKFRDSIKGKMKSLLLALKREGAAAAKFNARVQGKQWGMYVSKSQGGAQDKIALRLVDNVSGAKPYKGRVFWDPKTKAYVFEGPVPTGGGSANALAISLKGLLGFRPKVRLQKPGEVGEDSDEGEADPDEQAQDKDKDKKEADTPHDSFLAKLQELNPKIKSASDGASAGAKRLLLAAVLSANDLAKAGKGPAAEKELLRIEELIAAAEASKSEKGQGEAGDGKANDGVTKAAAGWAKARDEAIKGIEELAGMIETEYAGEQDQLAQAKTAAQQLRDKAKVLKPDLDKLLEAVIKEKGENNRIRIVKGARTLIERTRAQIASDKLLKELDGNELMPSMSVVKPMLDSLDLAETSLG